MKLKFPKWDSYYAYTLCKYFNIPLNYFYGLLSKDRKRILYSICSLASLANVTIFDDALYEVDAKDRNDFFNNFISRVNLFDDRITIVYNTSLNPATEIYNSTKTTPVDTRVIMAQ